MAQTVARNAQSAADHVARNVRRIRLARGFSVRGLADRLSALQEPIPATSISKVEYDDPTKRRAVSVDELVAMALALRTSPAALLTSYDPAEDPGDVVQATPVWEMDRDNYEAWVRGTQAPANLRDNTVSPTDLGDSTSPTSRQEVRHRDQWLDQEPASVQRAERLDARRHPAREASRRAAATIDAALVRAEPDWVGGPGDAERVQRLVAHLRRLAEELPMHLRLLADELEREDADYFIPAT